MFVDHRLERFDLVVHDQRFRKFGQAQQFMEVVVVGDVERDMGVAAKNDWRLISLAKTQDLEVVVAGSHFLADGVE